MNKGYIQNAGDNVRTAIKAVSVLEEFFSNKELSPNSQEEVIKNICNSLNELKNITDTLENNMYNK